LPKVPESITSAASFACLETLGVLPPPEEGWLPRATGEQKDKEEVMWWANVVDQNWIYNGIEDKYFHLPTRSLWEKRVLESCDPYAPPYTFFRLDAMALEALRQFAGSVDKTLVPMVWQAWVRVVAKERRGVSNPSKSHSQGIAGSKPPLLPITSLPKFDEPAEIEKPPPAPEASVAQAEVPVPAASNQPSEDKPLSSSPLKPRRKKGFCFCVFARFGRSGEEEDLWEGARLSGKSGTDEARTPSTSAGSSAASQVRSAKDAPPAMKGVEGGGPVPTAAPGTVVTSPKKEESTVTEAVKSEIAELHGRRLEQFLNEVKKNPQRLVTHVEKRRAEKTGMAFLT